METKQVIIQNKVEETEFLNKAHKLKLTWFDFDKPSETIPSRSHDFEGFPIIIQIGGTYSWQKKCMWWNYYIAPLTVSQFLESVDN